MGRLKKYQVKCKCINYIHDIFQQMLGELGLSAGFPVEALLPSTVF